MPVLNYKKNMEIRRTNVTLPGVKPHERFCENNRNKLILVAIGALIGFLLCMTYILWIIFSKILTDSASSYPQSELADNTTDMKPDVDVDAPAVHTPPQKSRDALYIGVLTLQPYLDTRARACNDTWGQSSDVDKLEFYAKMTSSQMQSSELPMVPLSGRRTGDAWHTEKSLLMLEYMCAHHANQYDWFMRAVDDAYVDVTKLRRLLSKLDNSKEMLLGHPTLPIDDSSFKALNGREYCLGGPGLVFSRPLLHRVCPHLPSCRRRLSNLPADVAIAKCISESVGVECVFLPQLHHYFVHSFEKNQFHLLDEFSRHERTAITYHPLKEPWMMHALHHKINTRRFQQALVDLKDMEHRRAMIQAELYGQPKGDEPETRSTKDAASVTYLTNGGIGYTTDTCDGKYKLKQSEVFALEQAKRLADTSISWGHSQKCSEVFSSLRIQLPTNQLHIIDMECQNRADNSPTLARAVLSRPAMDVYLNKVRTWKTSRHLVIVVKARLQDPNLVYYILRLRRVVSNFGKTVILNIIYAHNDNVNERTSVMDEHIISDLKDWASHRNLVIRTYKIESRSRNIYRDSLSDLAYDFRDATILFTSVEYHFGKDFLHRCLALVKEGLQFYNPRLPKTIDETIPSVSSGLHFSLRSVQHRPICIHMQDFIATPASRSRRQKSVRSRDALLVNTAVDPDLTFSVI